MQNVMIELGFFEFCPACHGQITIGHREGCQLMNAVRAAVLAERQRCFDIAEEVRRRELKNYSGRSAFHVIAEEIRERIQGNWKETSFDDDTNLAINIEIDQEAERLSWPRGPLTGSSKVGA